MNAPGFPIAHGVVASPVRVSRMISATPCAVISYYPENQSFSTTYFYRRNFQPVISGTHFCDPFSRTKYQICNFVVIIS
jgi:hypothetical protein